jgi:hypothetical protein
VASIESGVRQGDALAGLFFNLGIMAVLKEAVEVAPSVIIMFYSDDGNLLGASVLGYGVINLCLYVNLLSGIY